jgi:DNA repair exonuclease SbcCD nuclease subunit
MKLLLTSDWHLDAVTGGFPRYSDLEIAVRQTVDVAIREQVDLYVFLGDLANPEQKAFAVQGLVGWVMRTLAKEEIRSRWMVGNHDVLEDGSGASTLSAFAHVSPWVHVYDRPSHEVLADVDILALPFAARSHAYDPVQAVMKVQSDAERILVFGHLMIEGIQPGSETRDMPRGREVLFPLDACREHFGMRARLFNGHYHRRQTFRGITIPGALERLTRGEIEHEPGFLIVDV